MTEDEKWLAEPWTEDLGDHVNPYARASQPSGVRNRPYLGSDVKRHATPNSPEAEFSGVDSSRIRKNCLDPLAVEGVGECLVIPAAPSSECGSGKSELAAYPALMTIEDVADHFRCSTSKINRLRNEDPDFPQPLAFPGRVTRWHRHDIDAYIERKRAG